MEIPLIDSKNAKKGDFALHNRKTSPFFPFAGYSIQDKTSYLKESESRDTHFNTLR